jgi:tetratricopeptide (TPR) repeat protein
VTSAARVLGEALKTERDEDVVCAVLRSLGVLAENRDELKQEVGPKVVQYLKDERDTVVVAALKAIAQTGTGSDCRAVEDLYSEAAMAKKDRSAVRSQIVTTLYSLDCGSAVILTALEDVSADVRMSAARGLGYTKRIDAAPQIAKALAAEKNDEAQRVMARALYALQSYPPEVVDALADVAGKPSVARDAAVRGLVQAASVGQLDGARADRVAALLFDTLPVISASPEKRKVVLDDLKAAKGELLAKVLLKWLEVEAQPDLARELAGILPRLVPAGTETLAGHAKALIAAGRAPAAVVLLRAAVDQAGSASAPVTTRALRHPELRISLAKALLIEKTVDGLTEAETIASQELRANPDDGQLLLLRGSIREAQGRRTEAAEDLRRALKSEGAAMNDVQRREAERRAAGLLIAIDARKAKEFLESLPQQSRDRDYLVLLGSAELALGEGKEAIAHFRTALGPGTKEETGVVRYHLIQALLKSPQAADRLEAKTLFEALDAEPPLPEGHPLLPLREEVKAQTAARNAVRDLDEISQEGATSSLATVINLGTPALPWLFHQFAEAARSAPLPALERRREAVEAILASDVPSARAFAALAPPANGSQREAWIDFSARAADWWDKRK